MFINRKTLLSAKARYTANSGKHCYADIIDINHDTATLSFTVKTKTSSKIAVFSRKLEDIVIFINIPTVNKDDKIYYWSNYDYNLAVVEDIESDPANGTIIRLRNEENGKVFETGIKSLYVPIAYDKITGCFKLANLD